MKLDTIICGNCLDVMAEMPDGCMDAIITDPPYQIGLNKQLCSWDIWPRPKIWKQLYRVVKKDGYLVLSLAPHIAHERILDILEAGWKVLEVGFWVYGAGRPVTKMRLKRCYDLVYFLSKNNRMLFIENARGAFQANTITGRKGKIIPTKGKLGRQFHKCESRKPYICGKAAYHPANVACEVGCDAFGESRYDLIFAVKRLLPLNQAKKKHPTGKPIDLIAQQIKLVSGIDDIIFDPFIGSGTTAVAALKLGRHFYGCDVNPDYVEMANKRIEKARLEMAQMSMDL